MQIPVDIKLKTETIPLSGADVIEIETTETIHKGKFSSIDGGYMLQYKSNMTDNTIAVFDKLITVNRTGHVSSFLKKEEAISALLATMFIHFK